jgi:hypothetical protein
MALLNAMVKRAGAGCGARDVPRLWFMAAALLLVGGPATAQAVRAAAPQVEAVFLFNFAQFVNWPAESFPDSQAPLVIGILGEDPFGGFLDETVRGETVRARPLEVRRYRRIEEVNTCHILFISRSEADRLEDLLPVLKDRPILAVSDGDGFARRGGMIQFVIEQSRIRLRINLEAAEAARLKISSKLLRAAEIVTPRRR